jgi:FKBP-type peptidyl-prolyl cis-trans isomerase 2
VFDSSEDGEPLEFVLGSGQVIPGFDNAVNGMKLDESKKVTIPADQAYGPHHSQMVVEVELDKFGPDMKPEKGKRVHLSMEDGHQVPVTITAVGKTHATLDANHPLAGKDLTFDLRLVGAGPVPDGYRRGCGGCGSGGGCGDHGEHGDCGHEHGSGHGGEGCCGDK